ncbi:MAG TPA: hypothetical protein VFG74_04080 [Miltoncostaeaceae bacterium]|jgi:hypothetical protein|nr:hypothetical protein [Miltoncostaeaceae bacterium]
MHADPTRTALADPNANRLKTYRYLRVGMVLLMVLLGVSILVDRADGPAGRFQTSISDYYYTPVQSVLVGSLVAVGACLIIMRAERDVEDIFLNLAGMFAALVAFVPIDRDGVTDGVLSSASAAAFVDNNVTTVVITGAVALVVAVAVMVRSWPLLDDAMVRVRRVLGLVAAGAIVLGTWLWYDLAPDSFQGTGDKVAGGHFTAAIALFVCMGVVVLCNALPPTRPPFHAIYAGIVALMVLNGVAAVLFGLEVGPFDWRYWLLAVEVAGIALFVVFWLVQTLELGRVQPNDQV